MPRASGHARSRVSTLNRVLARQGKEIIETALEECYGQVSGPSGAATKLGLPARTLDSFAAGLDQVRKSWGWFLACGILLTILGVVCIGKAQTATTFSIRALGWVLAFSGCAPQEVHTHITRCNFRE